MILRWELPLNDCPDFEVCHVELVGSKGVMMVPEITDPGITPLFFITYHYGPRQDKNTIITDGENCFSLAENFFYVPSKSQIAQAIRQFIDKSGV